MNLKHESMMKKLEDKK